MTEHYHTTFIIHSSALDKENRVDFDKLDKVLEELDEKDH